MQDAFNLAWKLAMAIGGPCSDSLLDSYSQERSKVGDAVLKGAERLTALGVMRNPVAQTTRNLVAHLVFGFSPVQHALAERMTEVSIGYPASRLNGPGLSSGPRPGERVVPDPHQPPVGSGDTPRFVLFADATHATAALVKRFERLLDPDIRPAFVTDGIWLVRPDGYMACSSTDADVIAQYLEGLSRPSVAG